LRQQIPETGNRNRDDTQPAADEAAKDESGVKTGALGGKGGIRGEGSEAGDAEGGDGSGSDAGGAANGGPVVRAVAAQTVPLPPI